MISSDFLHGLYIVPVLAFLILAHEAGHFFAARKCGVKVEEFGLGIPPRARGWMWKDVLWSINWIPFGGFVRVKGEDASNLDTDSMNAKSPFQRALFLAAGAAMNVVAAILLMTLVVGVHGIDHQHTYLGSVEKGSPAESAGLMIGDRIIEVNGFAVESSSDVLKQLDARPGVSVRLLIESAGIKRTVFVESDAVDGRMGVGLTSSIVGQTILRGIVPGSPAAAAGLQERDQLIAINGRVVSDFYVADFELSRTSGSMVTIEFVRNGAIYSSTLAVPSFTLADTSAFNALGVSGINQVATPERLPFLKIIPRGISETFKTSVYMISGISKLFSSWSNVAQLTGPVGMGQLTSQLIGEGSSPVWVTLANISIILSLNLALLNLLPFPALDGGRLVFVLLEVLRGGRRISPQKEGLIHFAGLAVLILFMLGIGFLDIGRIVEGNSLLS